MSEKNSKAAILPQNPPSCQSSDWQRSIRSTDALFAETPMRDRPPTYDSTFPLKIPLRYAQLIQPNDAQDPLLKQVLPQPEEALQHPDFSADPTKDLEQQPIPGLLHKYPGRALLITTGACAIHCRYCFRRHYPYAQQQIKPGHWQQILAYLDQHQEITEVIFSGGDPLTLADDKLIPMLQDVQALAHVDTIRFHTRLLTFMPERSSEALENWFTTTACAVVMVYHINHGNEINPAFANLTQRLQTLGLTQLNQSVLLKGVNDDADTLESLSRALFRCHVLPYYLHQLDPVQGAAHFQVPLVDAKRLHTEIKNRLPGYLTPKLVYEQPHALSKQWLS